MLSTIPGMTLEKCTYLSQKYSSMNNLCASFTDERPKSPSTPSSSLRRNNLPGIHSLEKQLEQEINKKTNEKINTIQVDENIYRNVKHYLSSDSLHYITMLCQIPGIDMSKASLISEYFPTMSELCFGFRQTSSPYLLKEIIEPKLSTTVYEYIMDNHESFSVNKEKNNYL